MTHFAATAKFTVAKNAVVEIFAGEKSAIAKFTIVKNALSIMSI